MAGWDLLTKSKPHFVQVGNVPVFQGVGADELSCRCGAPLIRGYLPGNFRRIAIQCFQCGEITTTPDMPLQEILPRSVIAVDAAETPVPTTVAVPPGAVLACSKAVTEEYSLTRPTSLPDEPFHLSRPMLENAAANYNRLSGGRLDVHLANAPPGAGSDHGAYPFAWSLLRLREVID